MLTTTRALRSSRSARYVLVVGSARGAAVTKGNDTGGANVAPQKPQAMTFSKKATRREWLLDGFIPTGTVTLITGDKATGKSTLLTAVAASVMGGPSLPGKGKPGKPGNVCWLTREESYGADVVPRLHASGVKQMQRLRVPVSSTATDSAADWAIPRDMGKLREWIDKQKIRLLILDPLATWCDPPDTVYQPTLCRPMMEALVRLASETGCTITPIVHLNKDESRSLLGRTLGAGELNNVCRSVVRIYSDTTDPSKRYLASVACNIAAAPKPLAWRMTTVGESRRVEWLGEVDTTAEKLAERSGDSIEKTLVRECSEWLTATLTDATDAEARPTVPATAIQKMAVQHGFSVRTLWRAKSLTGVLSIQVYDPEGKHHRVWIGPPVWPSV